MVSNADANQSHAFGRWWLVDPLFVLHAGAAVWLGASWQPARELGLLVISFAAAIFFASAWLLEKPKSHRETWAIGLYLQMVGLLVMAIAGVFGSLGSPVAPVFGFTFFACLFGMVWSAVHQVARLSRADGVEVTSS